ncbi:polysaccharide lyase 8 family protein [Streptomyces sp. NPDC020681]|uniref:polysaccharide lyase 8 family protein n=1 Tax=Streptomyces sp. NPDC020681 TaxID=3365083 RepID=UPI003797C528
MSPLSRRTFLASSSAAAAAAAASLPVLTPQAFAAEDDFALIRRRWADWLTGGEVDIADPDFATKLSAVSATAADLLGKLNTSPDREYLWEELSPVTDSANFRISYGWLLGITGAWATKGSDQYNDDAIAQRILEGIDFLYAKVYNENATQTGNWWDWQIGSPNSLLGISVLLYDRLGVDRLSAVDRTIGRWVPATTLDGRSLTGANRASMCRVAVLHGAVADRAERIAHGRDAVSDLSGGGENSLFGYVESDDGFYRDGSFIQHHYIPYVGSYGVTLLEGVASLMALLSGTPWQITDPDLNVITDSVDKTFAPFLADGGLMMDTVRGRSISREADQEDRAGYNAISSILLLARGVDDATAAHCRSLVKGWFTRGRMSYTHEYANMSQVALLKEAIADPASSAAKPLDAHIQMADSDRVVHRRATWSVALSLSSKRIARCEVTNRENLRGWYIGDGMTYLYLPGDTGQFNTGFWPSVDPYRLPGTTSGLEPREQLPNGYHMGLTDWAGGVAIGRYGAAGLDQRSYDEKLTAKKSWFFLEDAVVMLGAGITSTGSAGVETTVENRNLRLDETAKLTIDGRGCPTGLGWEETYSRARWAHLEGVGGYLFLDRKGITARRLERTGTWRDLTVTGTTVPITKPYLLLSREHGVGPVGDSYAYALLPTAGSLETRIRSAVPGFTVLSNTAAVQALSAGRRLFLANFWSAGSAGLVDCQSPASVAVARERGLVTVAVSDPSRTTEKLTVRVSLPVGHVVSRDDTVAVTRRSAGAVTLCADLAGTRGHTQSITFRAV